MSRFHKYPVLLFFVCFWIFKSCDRDAAVSYQIIYLEGVSWATNISTNYASFGSTTESEKPGRVGLPVSDGDLLYIFNEDGLELYYRYKLEDGARLTVSFDTLNTVTAHVNGMPAFIQLSEDSSSWEAFSKLPSQEVNQLSTLYISDHLTREILALLRNHESSLSGIGLVLENKPEEGAIKELLSFCRPKWMGLPGGGELSSGSGKNFLADLELLWISENVHAVSSMLQCCTNLESLIITDWEPHDGELVSLANLENLHSITLGDCSIKDLSNFDFPVSLERLHLITCETLNDISGLEQLSGLSSLSLTGSEDVGPLKVIEKLESLKWISFPVNTSQEDFQSILEVQQSLEVAELINCPRIKDISYLQNLPKLQALIYQSEEYRFDQFNDLDHLKLLILDHSVFEDSPESISRLQTILPNTEIVPGSGLCLGSGWLMLLLPLVLLVRYLFRRNVSNRS